MWIDPLEVACVVKYSSGNIDIFLNGGGKLEIQNVDVAKIVAVLTEKRTEPYR